MDTHRRFRLFPKGQIPAFVIILFFISIVMLNAQVRIKEKVEIKPDEKISFSSYDPIIEPFKQIQYVPGAKLKIIISGFWEQDMRGSVIRSYRQKYGFNPYTETDNGHLPYTYEEGNFEYYETTSLGLSYTAQIYFKNYDPSDRLAGFIDVMYNNDTIASDYILCYADNVGEFPNTPWFGISRDIAITIIGYPYKPCPESYSLNIPETYDLQYGEAVNIFTETYNGCGYSVEPPERFFKYELLGDTPYATLRDMITGRTGTVLDSVECTAIEFDAFGKEPDALQTLTLKASSVNGSIVPATKEINVYPPEVRAIPGKSVLTYGDTTSLTIEVRQPGGNWMPIPYDWYGSYSIIRADTLGFLYNIDSTNIGSYIDTHEPRINFASNPGIESDSIEVLIQLFAWEPCYDCEVNSITPLDTTKFGSGRQLQMPSMVLKQRTQENVLTNNKPPMLKQQIQNNISKKSVSTTASPIRVNNNWHYGLARLKLKNEKSCVLVIPESDELMPEEETALELKKVGADGIQQDYPAGQLFDIMILGQGENIGLLKANGDPGTRLTAVTQPISYIAPADIAEDSLMIQIVAAESGSGSGITVKTNRNGLNDNPIFKTKGISNSILSVLKRTTDGSSCQREELIIKSVIGFNVTATPSYLKGTDAATIKADPVDKGGKKVTLKEECFVNVWIHTEDEAFGTLQSPNGSRKSLLNVKLSDLKAGNIKFVPDPSSVTGIFPQGVRIGVSSAKNPKIEGSTGVIIKGNSVGEWFAQGDLRWAGQQYDKYIDTIINGDTSYYYIKDKGCALSCMAMAMSAYETLVNPGTLATYMDENGYWGKNGRVGWDAVGDYDKSRKLGKVQCDGDGLDENGNGEILKQNVLDTYLSKVGPVLVQVSNKQRNHWVLVTKKRGNNYDILDPGSKENNKTSLSEYGDTNNPIKIYAIRYFPSK